MQQIAAANAAGRQYQRLNQYSDLSAADLSTRLLARLNTTALRVAVARCGAGRGVWDGTQRGRCTGGACPDVGRCKGRRNAWPLQCLAAHLPAHQPAPPACRRATSTGGATVRSVAATPKPLTKPPPKPPTKPPPKPRPPPKLPPLPKLLDWRSKGKVTPVGDQKDVSAGTAVHEQQGAGGWRRALLLSTTRAACAPGPSPLTPPTRRHTARRHTNPTLPSPCPRSQRPHAAIPTAAHPPSALPLPPPAVRRQLGLGRRGRP